MSRKEPTLALLLDYLYGLLEADEQRQVEELVRTDEQWRAALARARRGQDILAEAAKGSFESVRFETPAAGDGRSAAKDPPAPRRPRRTWPQWALAATVLLAVGLGGWAGLSWYELRREFGQAADRYAAASAGSVQGRQQLDAALQQGQADLAAEAKKLTADFQEEQNQLNREIGQTRQKVQALEEEWKGEADAVNQQAAAGGLQVVVTGPQTLQAGALNEYWIETRANRGGQPSAAEVRVQVVDPRAKAEGDRVLYAESLKTDGRGVAKVQLPRDLPVTPGRQLNLQVVARGDAGLKAAAEEPLPLVGSLYLTHLTTDRPMYRPGETVRFRSLTLDRFSLKPPAEPFQVTYTVTDSKGNKVFEQQGATQLVAADGGEVRGPAGGPLQGIGTGEFTIPADAAGGEYALEVRDAANKFPAQQRAFLVNKYQAPQLNKELEFTRKSYGAGDEVTIKAGVRSAKGEPVADQPAWVTVRVDGREQPTQQLRTDGAGSIEYTFPLPAKIDQGVGTVAVKFTDGGNVETIVRPIPIVLKKLAVSFYPEGGDLVAGVENRVYFDVRNTIGKPADLQGRVVDQDGTEVARARTLTDDTELGVNQGAGVFSFTPAAGRRYELKVDSPLGVEGRHLLPLPKDSGVVLSVPEGVVTDHIGATLRNVGKERELLVGAYCRGRLIDSKKVTLAAGRSADVALTPDEGVAGVYRVTVFEARQSGEQTHWLPAAERLIYRRPVRKLDFQVTPDKVHYSPGDRVTLKLSSEDERGEAAAAVALVSVIDRRTVKLADDKTLHSLPTHFYLTTEVKDPEDLEYADFLVSDHPKAEAALDLLLGTQGWRRFIEQDPMLLQKQREEARQLFAAQAAGQPKRVDVARLAVENVDREFAPKWQEGQEKLARAEQDRQAAQREYQQALAQQTTKQQQLRQEHLQKIAALQQSVDSAQAERTAAERKLGDYQQFLLRTALLGGTGLLLLAGLIAVTVGLARAVKQGSSGAGQVAVGFALLLIAVVGVGLTYFRILGVRETAGMAEVAMKEAHAPGRGMDKGGDDKAWAAEKGAMEMQNAMPDMAAPGGPPQPMAVPAGPQVNIAPGRPEVMDNAAPQPGAPFQNLEGGFDPAAMRPQADADFAGDRAEDVAVPGLINPAEPNLPAADRPADGLALAQQGFAAAEPQMAMPMAPMAGARPARGAGQEFRLLASDETLRRQRNFQQLAAQRLGRPVECLPPASQPFVVRVYAHRNERPDDAVRRDFAETLFWHPALVMKDGTAEVSFDLSDSVTSYRVLVWGHTDDGRLGAAEADIVARLPFTVEPKVPAEVSSTDKVTIPVTVANDTELARTVNLRAEANNLDVVGDSEHDLLVDAGERVRQLYRFRPSVAEGEARLTFRGKTQPFGADAVEQKVRIVPEGFPFVGSASDVLEGQAVHAVDLPEDLVPGSLRCRVQIFPSTLAELQKGLEGLLREPSGCFEQTSTSNYPNVMILSYMKETDQAAPEVEKSARQKLDSGYQKLTSFECLKPEDQQKRRGYEWFGGTAPPHESLTAYGLLQFRDMAKVYPVDPEMIRRTEEYLLGQRDGQGGFRRNPRALDSFGGAPQDVTDAYIVWALTESGTKADLSTELKALRQKAEKSDDPYFLSLVALSLLHAGDGKGGAELLQKIAGKQQDDGSVAGAQTSITRSGGRDLAIETTALATLGWLRANRPAEFDGHVRKAVQWIGRQRGGFGAFGSTQSTILALKALIEHTSANRRPAQGGELKLFVNDRPAGTRPFTAGEEGEILIELGPEHKNLLKTGRNKLRVELDKGSYPHTLTWSYNTLTPVNPGKCPVELTTKLSRGEAAEGETVTLTASVENKTGEEQGMTVAVIGLPAGLSLPEDLKQLKEMARLRDNDTRPGLIGAFEVKDRELILYWRAMQPGERVEVSVDLICRIPGEYRGPASRAYLYYNSDLKYWVSPLAAKVNPAE